MPKQIEYSNFGNPNVLEIKEIKLPEIKDNEILVKTSYNSIDSADSRIRAARFPKGFEKITKIIFGFKKPRFKVLGGTYSGVVIKTGKQVNNFKIDDKVCGMLGLKRGAYKENIIIKSNSTLLKIPEKIDLKTACASLFGGTTALYFLLDIANSKKGDNILINGASGSVGSAMVEIGKNLNLKVTGICSLENKEIVENAGAIKTIDYKKTKIKDIKGKYNTIIDTVGNLTFENTEHLLKENGNFIMLVGSLKENVKATIGKLNKKKGKKCIAGTSPERISDLKRLMKIIEKGNFKPIISKIYGYKDVKKAHEKVLNTFHLGKVNLIPLSNL